MFYSISDDDYIQIENDGSLDTQQSLTILLWLFAEDGETAPLIENGADDGLALYYELGRELYVSNLRNGYNCFDNGKLIFLKQIYRNLA